MAGFHRFFAWMASNMHRLIIADLIHSFRMPPLGDQKMSGIVWLWIVGDATRRGRHALLGGLVAVCCLSVLSAWSGAHAELSSNQQNVLAAAGDDPEALAAAAAALALVDPENAAEIAQAAGLINPDAALRISVAVARAAPDAGVAIAEVMAPIARVENAAALAAALSSLAPERSPDIASAIASVFPDRAATIIAAVIDLNGAAVNPTSLVSSVAQRTGLDETDLGLRVAIENIVTTELSVERARQALEDGNVSFLVAERIDQNGITSVVVPDGGSEQQDQASGS